MNLLHLFYESEKVCKKCYRRLESLDKRLAIIKKDRQALLALYRSSKENRRGCDARFKREAKDGLMAYPVKKCQLILQPRTMCFDDVETGISETVESSPQCNDGESNLSHEENMPLLNKPAKVTVSSLFSLLLFVY